MKINQPDVLNTKVLATYSDGKKIYSKYYNFFEPCFCNFYEAFVASHSCAPEVQISNVQI